jgi:tetratricopeptide (TPR) repeat protein
VRIVHRLSLFVVLALTFIFTEPAWITSQGSCGYGYNSPYYYPPSQADIEQHMWDIEAYNFLNYDEEGYYPYGVPAYNAPTYNTLTHNTLAYNQSIGNGSATYYLNIANVSYLTGSYEQAAEPYAKAVNLDPSLKNGWLNLGNSLYYLRKYQASLNAYNTLLNLEPQNANALASRGQAILALNKIGKNTSNLM